MGLVPTGGRVKKLSKQETLAAVTARVGNWKSARPSGADYVSRLEPFGSLQQIELHGFALIQRTITVLLDRGEMNEDILPCGPLDKTVSLSPVEPFDCALLSHKKLLSPLLCVKFHKLREACASLTTPSKPANRTASAARTAEPAFNKKSSGVFRRGERARRKALEPVVVARISNCGYTQHQPELTTLLH